MGVTSSDFIVKSGWKKFYFVVLAASGTCEAPIPRPSPEGVE